MKGHIQSRGKDTWRIRVYMGLNADGRQLQKSFTVKGSRKDAEKELRRVLSQMDNGTYRQPTRQTLAQYMLNWLETTARMTVNAKTLERYAEIINNDLIPGLGSIELQKLTPADIRAYYAWATESGRKDGTGGLSKQTVLHYHRLLHRILERAVDDEVLVANPVRKGLAPYSRHLAPGGRSTSEGGVGTAGALIREYYAGSVFARSTAYSGRGCQEAGENAGGS